VGLRRTETAKLDLADWGRNPAAPEFGRFGNLSAATLAAEYASARARIEARIEASC
jgi:hypothetical protein